MAKRINKKNYFLISVIAVILIIGAVTFSYFKFIRTPSCTECQYLKDRVCSSYECCDSTYCEDSTPTTENICFSNNCVYPKILECIDNDGLCPETCILNTDNDCENNLYKYRNEHELYSFEYPFDWNKEEDIINRIISLTPQDESSYLGISTLENETTLNSVIENFLLSLTQIQGLETKLRETITYAGKSAIKVTQEAPTFKFIHTFIQQDNIIVIVSYAIGKNSDVEKINKIYDSIQLLEKPAVTPLQNPLLWKIKGKDSYLYGTIHIKDERVKAFPNIVNEAIQNSDAIYTEIILDKSLENELGEISKLPEGKTLQNTIPTSTYNRLKEYLATKNLPITAFENQKPWAISLSLNFLNFGAKDESETLDEYISSYANNYQKELGGLEKPIDQISLFDNLTIEEQIDLLEDSLDSLILTDKIGYNPSLNELLDAYLVGDEKAILYAVQSETKEDNQYIDLIINNRNA